MEPEQSSRVLPPLEPVRQLQAALGRAGIESVVGGSGLLASLGLVDVVHDWDLVIDADPEAVQRVLGDMGLPHSRKPREGIFHSSAALLVDAQDHSIDVLIGFALESGDGIVHIPASPGAVWQGLQMARVQEWILAYRLLGRPERAQLLQRCLESCAWSPRQDSNLRHPL